MGTPTTPAWVQRPGSLTITTTQPYTQILGGAEDSDGGIYP